MMNMSTRTKLFLSHFFTIMLIIVVIGGFFYKSATNDLMNSLQSRLLNSSALLAQSFDVSELNQLRHPSSEKKAVSAKNVRKIRELVETNSDIAFIYLMRLVEGHVYFIIDSDKEAPAFTGELYENPPAALIRGFDQPSVDDMINEDQWGSFLSGYAPIKGGKDKMLVGIDMRADQVHEKFVQLRKNALISCIAAIIIAFLLSHFLSRHFTHRMDRLMSLFSEVAQKPIYELIERDDGDELDRLSFAFDILAKHINEEQTRNEDLKQNLEEKLAAEIQQRLQLEEQLQQDQTHIKKNMLNQRAIMQIIKNEMKRHAEDQHPFNLALLRFKYIDGFDDELVIQVSTYLNTLVSESDVFARWDTKTLILMLPNMSENDVTDRIQQMQLYLESSDFFVDEKYIKLLFHVGINTYHEEKSLDETIRCLDMALNEARDSRGNSIVFWSGQALSS